LLLTLAALISGCSYDGSFTISSDRHDGRSNGSYANGKGRSALGVGRVIAAGSMTAARAAHTATLLPDGRVLIAGGCTLDSCELEEDGASAELYDPRVGNFAKTGTMGTERVSHTATLLPNGEVLLAGGWDRDGVLASAELYDPAAGVFSPTGSMAIHRAAHTATLLPEGKVLIAGGYNGNQSVPDAEIYDPRTGTFERTGSLTTPRSAHAAALLPNGRVLATGGSDSQEEIVASAEIYDPDTGRFIRTGNMSVNRYKHGATSLRDGKILILGGSDADDFHGKYASAELFDPESGTFTAVDDMNAERFKLPDAVATLSSGEVLVGGDSERAEIYDPESNDFRTVHGSLGAARNFATVTTLSGGRALIAGGYDRDLRLAARTWLYVPAN
jgi:Kelch motif/Galactose oxidase, central domain